MDLGIEGKRAVVTGGSRGIGAAISKALASAGVRVAVVARNSSDIDSLLGEIGGTDAGHYGCQIDLQIEGSGDALFAILEKEFGPVDIAVQNMGGTLEVKDPLCAIEDWRRVLRLNLEVAVELNRLLVPHMRKKKWGRIVHISSIAGLENIGPVTYCAAKAALCAYTRSLGRVLAREGIVVSAVLPGVVLTEGGYWESETQNNPEHVEEYLLNMGPLHRFGTTDEIAHIAAFLCSELASFMQGALVPVDGGQMKGYFI